MTNIRLSKNEITAIRKAFIEFFPVGDKLWLFGSRVDSNRRGGDIDLYIETSLTDYKQITKARANFYTKLQIELGEQKIDIVVKFGDNDFELPIYKEARNEGVFLVNNTALLRSTSEACDVQATRLKSALEHLEHLLPFTQKKLEDIKYEDLTSLDMMTTRFAKLQDLIGEKIFTFLLIEMREDKIDATFIDRVNKLEKVHILPSKQEWIKIRDLRNHITHEYPDNPQLMVDNLNQCVEYSKHLIEYWVILRAKIMEILNTECA